MSAIWKHGNIQSAEWWFQVQTFENVNELGFNSRNLMWLLHSTRYILRTQSFVYITRDIWGCWLKFFGSMALACSLFNSRQIITPSRRVWARSVRVACGWAERWSRDSTWQRTSHDAQRTQSLSLSSSLHILHRQSTWTNTYQEVISHNKTQH